MGALWVIKQQMVGLQLLNTLSGCVMDEGAWMCPAVYCGDAAVAYNPEQVDVAEDALYITGNISVGVSTGIPINCSTTFRGCLMRGQRCVDEEALGQKNRPLSLALQYDEVSIMWDWAATSGSSALALLKPECPHPLARNCDMKTVLEPKSDLCLADCKDHFDGLYYHVEAYTNLSYHYYSSIVFIPTTWTAELYKISLMNTAEIGPNGDAPKIFCE